MGVEFLDWGNWGRASYLKCVCVGGATQTEWKGKELRISISLFLDCEFEWVTGYLALSPSAGLLHCCLVLPLPCLPAVRDCIFRLWAKTNPSSLEFLLSGVLSWCWENSYHVSMVKRWEECKGRNSKWRLPLHLPHDGWRGVGERKRGRVG